MRATQRARQTVLAVTLTLALLTAPFAWAVPGSAPGPDGWFNQLWDLVAAWIAPSERGASMDPSGLQATVERSIATTTKPTREPVPFDPSVTDASTEEDDRGAGMDPDG